MALQTPIPKLRYHLLVQHTHASGSTRRMLSADQAHDRDQPKDARLALVPSANTEKNIVPTCDISTS